MASPQECAQGGKQGGFDSRESVGVSVGAVVGLLVGFVVGVGVGVSVAVVRHIKHQPIKTICSARAWTSGYVVFVHVRYMLRDSRRRFRCATHKRQHRFKKKRHMPNYFVCECVSLGSKKLSRSMGGREAHQRSGHVPLAGLGLVAGH